MNNKTIIAIYPNTLGFGYVIINHKGEIRDFGIVPIRPVSNQRCMERINEMISYHNPQILILEHHSHSRKSARTKNLNKLLYEEWRRDISVYRYTQEQVRETFEIFGAKNKYEINQKIVEAYPQFKTKLPDKRKPWEPENYYQGLFDAISLVLVHHYLVD